MDFTLTPEHLTGDDCVAFARICAEFERIEDEAVGPFAPEAPREPARRLAGILDLGYRGWRERASASALTGCSCNRCI